MMNLTIKVDYKDGNTATVKTRPATEIAFERRFNLGLGEAFTPEKTGKKTVDGEDEYVVNTAKLRMEWLYFLAFHAATQPGGDFDAWMETITDIEMVDTESPDPSPAAASTI